MNRSNARIFLVLLVCLIPAWAGGAIDTWCSIELAVGDVRGSGLRGVEVAARSDLLFDERTGETDEGGRLQFKNLPPGSFAVSTGKIGYQWVEIEEVRCPPGSTVRLVVTLEEAEFEEVVVLGSGPVLEAGSTGISFLRSQEANLALPNAVQVHSAPVFVDGLRSEFAQAGPPEAVRGWQGSATTGAPADASRYVSITTQPLEPQLRGRVMIKAGRGAAAEVPSTRGVVTTLDRASRAELAIGGTVGASWGRWFAALDGRRLQFQAENEFSGMGTTESTRRSQNLQSDLTSAFGVLRLNVVPAGEVDLRWSGGRMATEGAPATLHVEAGSQISASDTTVKSSETRLGWSWIPEDRVAVSLGVAYQNSRLEIQPYLAGTPIQDQTAAGVATGGLGNGVWQGTGGVPSVDELVDGFDGRARLDWSLPRGHGIGISASWISSEQSIGFGSVGELGASRSFIGSNGESWTEDLAVAADVAGRLRRGRLKISDRWRATSNLTVHARVAAESVEFNSPSTGRGYTFGLSETLEPGLGLVWDFEGNGRSRAWIRWQRTRPSVEPVIHRRLMGGLDVHTTFDPSDSESPVRPPGELAVDPELEPARLDETVLGVEYEVLSRVVVGSAVVSRRLRDGVATLSDDRGQSYEVGSPSGEPWPDTLWNDRLQAMVWARKQLSSGWQAELHLEWSKSVGTWQGSAAVDDLSVDREWLRDVVVPESLVGAEGPLPDDRRWRFLLQGSWTFLNDWVLGSRLSYRSGAPVSRLGALSGGFGLDRRFVDWRGAGGRSPSLWRVDVLLVWPVELSSGALEARFEVLNLFDNQRAVAVDERWSLIDQDGAAGLNPDEQLTTETWGEAFATQRPLEIRLGFGYIW